MQFVIIYVMNDLLFAIIWEKWWLELWKMRWEVNGMDREKGDEFGLMHAWGQALTKCGGIW